MTIFVCFLVVGLAYGAQESNQASITRIVEEKPQPVKPSWNFKDGSISLQNVYAEPLGSMVRFYFPCILLLLPKMLWIFPVQKKTTRCGGGKLLFLELLFLLRTSL